jgi:pyridoxine 5-phosphate synthase
MNPLVSAGADDDRATTALSVNVNKIALLRNTRALTIPDVVRLSRIALEAGAHGITVHPRPDERHIRRHDVMDLAALMRDWPQAEFNIEGNPLHNLLQLAEAVASAGGPLHQLTFVPDSVEQATSDHGWNLPAQHAVLVPLVARARALGARVSLFMDPVPDAMPAVRATGAERVELYTETYARAHGTPQQGAVLAGFAAAGAAARRAGLGLNAGHDLNRDNLGDFLRAVPGVQEVSIGHALVADALELGLAETVRAYRRVIHLAGRPA